VIANRLPARVMTVSLKIISPPKIKSKNVKVILTEDEVLLQAKQTRAV
jgi:hypothetical protein